jgi:glycosyltransferase involved in cell wall biosynthesis
VISIILPVYNGEKYLRNCIESILDQSFQQFELLVINDGSVDYSENIIKEFEDPRIRYFGKSNTGLSDSLNYGISKSNFELICRIDQDDLMRPDRLVKQYEYMNENISKFAVCTFATMIDDKGKIVGQLKPPKDENWIQFQINFENRFIHSGIMFRKSVLRQLGGYSTNINLQPPEDFELWSKALKAYPYSIGVLPEYLTFYRVSDNSMSRKHPKMVINSIKICHRNVETLPGLSNQSAKTLNIFIFNIHTRDKVKFILNFRDLYCTMIRLWILSNSTISLKYKIRIILFILKYAVVKPFAGIILQALKTRIID